MSKVVHLRLSDESIYTCMQVLQKSGINTINLPLATIVRRYLEGSTDNYRRQVHLSMPDDLPSIIAILADDSPIPIEMPEVGFVEQAGQEFDQDKLDNIKKAMQNSFDDDTAPEISTQEAVDEPEVLPPKPWHASHILAWSDIRMTAPMDVLIDKAVKESNDILAKAIQCVYSDIPTHEWGSKHTIKLVEQIIPTIEKYFEEK